MDLTCPKCHGAMRTYERNGVHVDQCAECRGIFLDRGELDRLIDAENQWHDGGKETSRPDQQRHDQGSAGGLGAVVGEVLQQVRGSQKHGGSSHGYDPRYGQGYGHKPRKKESFLSDLFG
jgi:Zn-finger nucleic acid-binding protein